MTIRPSFFRQSPRDSRVGCLSLRTSAYIWRAFILATLLAAGMVPAQEDPSLPAGSLLLPESELPDYEKSIDHAGLIRGWNTASFNRGREIYQQVCHNCHGDLHLPGSIPLSLRFGQGRIQHGSDPYAMYQTLTRGWRLMAPQIQLVPREKYDVIHYIREEYLRDHNPSQWFEITPEYLAKLPKGISKGPPPAQRRPWLEMDYDNFLIGTFEITDAGDRAARRPAGQPEDYVAPDANIAYKAVAIRLDPGEGGVARGSVWLAFEHDTLRVAGLWTGNGFIDWHGINFDGRHVVRPRTVGDLLAETTDVPGWAHPETGSFEDQRFRGLDGRPYGPLPRSWARFKGLYRHGDRVVVSYSVGDTAVLECHQLESTRPMIVARVLHVGPSTRDLALRAANAGGAVGITVQGPASVQSRIEDAFHVVRIPARATPVEFTLLYAPPDAAPLVKGDNRAVPDLKRWTQGGPARWTNSLDTTFLRASTNGPFAVDVLSLPSREINPWKSWMRLSGLDFLPGEDAAVVCNWDGEVWRVDGIGGGEPTVRWTRITSGLFQPLGIKIVKGAILVSCRDQIVRLRDFNDDGETDFYECVNSDHQVTEHFHEFAMGLQSDEAGNLYYAKSARHARPPLVPHHGTLLKVSVDGSATEILANGFRAANGVCRNPDGTFIVTDQEGHWNPMNRINWVVPNGRFYGNMWSYGAPDDTSDAAMEPPLCWVDKQFDRSPSELLWVESPSWGPLNGALLNLSYGFGRIEIVPHERVDGAVQGGVCTLPIPDFPTGTMRGRFRPEDGHLYLCGMSAWGTAQMQLPGGLYRIRHTGEAAHLPIGLNARKTGMNVIFSDPLDPQSVADLSNVEVRTWGLKRSEQYGSRHYNKRELKVTQARLSSDGRTVALTLPDIEPVWQMEIRYTWTGANGQPVEGLIQNSVHRLGD